MQQLMINNGLIIKSFHN